MDLRKLKTLIELVESSGIAELEISEGEERVRITRATAAPQPAYAPVPPPAAAVQAAPQPVTPAAEPARPAGAGRGTRQSTTERQAEEPLFIYSHFQ